ncbi:MAG: 23S rRNA (pseudouridine(1915)-N(3))-methyltransferase RlmH [Eubacteriales bacterium]|nr:23S rRNA (pseudouridine(1915)-N(3))-methyltransferase RlmH [Eubacteriales bacterium]
MQYLILCVGKIKDSYYRKQIETCCKQITKKQNQINIMEFPDEKIPNHLSEKEKCTILEKEGKKIADQINGRDYVIALCIEGKEITTKQHKQLIENARYDGYNRVVYLIGGSLGLDERLKERANKKISFSKMTFPHQLMRVVLCEEIDAVS